MSQLFEIPITPVKRYFLVTTFSGNRIALKLMNLLKNDGIYTVKRMNKASFIEFEISIMSKKSPEEQFNKLKDEILSYIPDHFPKNYVFYVGRNELGFINSFTLSSLECNLAFCHKIKEINKNSKIPEKQINF